MKNRHPLININIQRQSIQPTSEVSQASNTETSEATPAPGPSSSSSCAFSNENGRATTANTMPISNFLRKPPSARKQDQIDRQLVKMIVKGHHALRIVEEPDFKILVDMVSHCPGYQLPTRKTLSETLIPKIYQELFEQIQERIQKTQAICLGTDGWTATTSDSYIAITAHFINEDDTSLSSALLGCVQYTERHTSANLMALLKQTIQEWQIAHKVGSIVSDNAANVTGAIRLGGWRPIGCFAHSLNLMVQRAITDIRLIVDKVKAIVEFFKRSTQASHKLSESQKQMGLPTLKLKQECPTRWNSCYDIELERILFAQNPVMDHLSRSNEK